MEVTRVGEGPKTGPIWVGFWNFLAGNESGYFFIIVDV